MENTNFFNQDNQDKLEAGRYLGKIFRFKGQYCIAYFKDKYKFYFENPLAYKDTVMEAFIKKEIRLYESTKSKSIELLKMLELVYLKDGKPVVRPGFIYRDVAGQLVIDTFYQIYPLQQILNTGSGVNIQVTETISLPYCEIDRIKKEFGDD